MDIFSFQSVPMTFRGLPELAVTETRELLTPEWRGFSLGLVSSHSKLPSSSNTRIAMGKCMRDIPVTVVSFPSVDTVALPCAQAKTRVATVIGRSLLILGPGK